MTVYSADHRAPIDFLATCVLVLCVSGILLIAAGCGQARAGHGTALVHPYSTLIYAAENGGQSIGVIDINNGTIVGTITGVRDAFLVAISPDGSRLYVADTGYKAIIVIDATNGERLAQIDLGEMPWRIALSPDGSRAYVTVETGTLEVIDTLNFARIDTITVGAQPFGACVNPVTGDVYVINTGNRSLSMIKGGKVKATLQIGGCPYDGMAVTPDGSRLYVTDGYSEVYVIDTANDIVLTTIDTGKDSNPCAVAFSPEGAYAYVACVNDSISSAIKVFSTDSYRMVGCHIVAPTRRVVAVSDQNSIYLITSIGVLAMDATSGSILSKADYWAGDIAVAKGAWIEKETTVPDYSPPATSLNLSGTVDANDVYIGGVTFTLSATDNEGGFGVKLVEYYLPGSGWVQYYGPVSITTPGNVTMYYHATDNAGNVEPARAYVIRIAAPHDAVTPRPQACPTPSPTPKATASVLTPAPGPAACPTPAATPAAGFEAFAALFCVAAAGYAVSARKR